MTRTGGVTQGGGTTPTEGIRTAVQVEKTGREGAHKLKKGDQSVPLGQVFSEAKTRLKDTLSSTTKNLSHRVSTSLKEIERKMGKKAFSFETPPTYKQVL